jgi:hypothetical protein
MAPFKGTLKLLMARSIACGHGAVYGLSRRAVQCSIK